jgi:kinesin family protein 3/17
MAERMNKTAQAFRGESVKVVVRCRPLSPLEQAAGLKPVVRILEDVKAIDVQDLSSQSSGCQRAFSFDAVFGWDCGQEQVRKMPTLWTRTYNCCCSHPISSSHALKVYNDVVRSVVDSVLEGYNGTVFAYGQTGTGKTYTMEGEDSPASEGVTPRTFQQIFSHMQQCQDTTFMVCS